MVKWRVWVNSELKSNIYFFITDDGVGGQKATEMNKNVKKMKHEQRKDVLFSEKCARHEMKKIHSKNHKSEVDKINNISLPCF